MDGTSGRQFSTLRRRLQQMGIELVITHLPPSRCASLSQSSGFVTTNDTDWARLPIGGSSSSRHRARHHTPAAVPEAHKACELTCYLLEAWQRPPEEQRGQRPRAFRELPAWDCLLELRHEYSAVWKPGSVRVSQAEKMGASVNTPYVDALAICKQGGFRLTLAPVFMQAGGPEARSCWLLVNGVIAAHFPIKLV